MAETWVERKGKGKREVGPFLLALSFSPHRSHPLGKKDVIFLIL